jgi:hypothetical protein
MFCPGAGSTGQLLRGAGPAHRGSRRGGVLSAIGRRHHGWAAGRLPSKVAQLVVSLDCQFLARGASAQQLFGLGPAEVLGRY